MNKPLILVGGGHCKSVIDVAESAGYTILGILDMPEMVGSSVLGYPVLGTDDDIPAYVDKAEFVITVGHIKNNTVRKKIAERIEKAGGKLATIVASDAYVSKHATVGEGTVVMHEALQYAERYQDNGGIDYIDALLGPFTGRTMPPISTADFVGLDVHKAIVDNIYENTNDYVHEKFVLPAYAQKLIDEKKLGRKSGEGLYKLIKNDSGGLIGCGHPVGASGARMFVDLYKQVTGKAGKYQVKDAKNGMMLNIGGSATTNFVFIVGRV